MMEASQECDSKRIDAIHVYKQKFNTGRFRLHHVVFGLIYIYQIIWTLSTIGEPYHQFLEKADREGFQVMEGQTKMRAELEHSLGDIDDPNRRTGKVGWMDWMDMDIEEHAALKKREREKTVLDSLPKKMRVPSRYAPAFLPTLLLGILATLNALVILMQHWSVGFNVWLNYREVNSDTVHLSEDMMDLHLDADDSVLSSKKPDFVHQPLRNVPSYLPTHARVVPSKGRHVLVPIEYFPTLGMTIEYHRRRYIYKHDAGWIKIRCRTDIPLTFLESWKGFQSEHQVVSAQIRYGPNKFEVKQPTFGELYKAQLLSPFTVFQLFCVILWMLDDYWQYSAFTLFMIFTFEATVVFSRIKSLGALRGMGNKARLVWVYRLERWTQVPSTDLLPGDVMSLTRIKPHYAKNKVIEDEGGDVVPADLLLLSGSTVVNEASLTGESVPQMKEFIHDFHGGETLSMKTRDKMHVLYAGTKMLQCKPLTDSDDDEHGQPKKSPIPNPPDNGCLCFVLRTGFSSAQGKLVRMIEGSQEKVKGHERETGLLLLLLFFFAVASSSYVLYHGLQDENRSQYELLLHCILIITSVIPPELPMQMALAVNNSLMTLMKMQIFCTEPFRVPMAGKLDSCLFDKTGTLTTDELVAVGLCEPTNLKAGKDQKENLTAMTKVTGEGALVLAGCHSLVYIDEETTGDPLESAALKAMRWCMSQSTGHVVPSPATEKKPAGSLIRIGGGNVSEIEILTRHHFSSKLQRMSCVIRDCSSRKHHAVAKGSPEAIGNLLSSKPDGYDEQSKYLAKQGYRVIALSYKPLPNASDIESAKEGRASCELDLIFAGFVAFTCRVRKDTANVLHRLKEGGMSVAMVTGDALLTAAHVAKEVGICGTLSVEEDVIEEKDPELRALLKKNRKSEAKKPSQKTNYHPILILEQNDDGTMYWQSYDNESKFGDFVASNVSDLAKTHDLATTGKCLAAAFKYDKDTTKVLAHFKIFARMSPDAKETVIDCLHSVGSLCLMCGDGANDVGALKQADVGVALLSGFGDVNVDRGEESIKKKKPDENAPTAIVTQNQLNTMRQLPVMLIKAHIRKVGGDPDKYPEIVEKEDLIKLYQIKAREFAVKEHDKKNQLSKSKMSRAELQAKQRADMAEKQRLMQQRAEELAAQGEQWATFKAMKEFYGKEMTEAKKKGAQMHSVEGSAASIAAQLEDMETGDLPMVKLGDASIAAPFTSKMPSIRSCVDIVRQGRCTLVSSIQMYQILALNCLISSYSLSVLYLDGVKYGDTQMTAMGVLGSISFMSVSRSKPLDKLSPMRPLTSIFHPALFISLLGQFSIHLATMVIAVQSAKQHLPPDHKVELDGEFKPGILNTVVFLVSNVQQVTVFVVNLQGRPFMTGLTENRPLLWSLLATFILTFMFASETVPSLNKYFKLVHFPDDAFRDFILRILFVDVVGSFLFDRLMKFIFCPKILFASVESTTLKDVMILGRTAAVIGFLMYTFLGNNEQWEGLLQEEARLAAELAANEAAGNSTVEAIAEAAKVCVGAACDAAKATAGGNDEF